MVPKAFAPGVSVVYFASVVLWLIMGAVQIAEPVGVAHPMFYIYEWPEYLSDVYPPKGAQLHPNSRYDHSFNENNGAGIILNPEVGLFQTWQFSLFKNIMSRLRVSKYRTR